MDRRRFVAAIGGALAAPLARAQQPVRPRRVGLLELRSDPTPGLPGPQRTGSQELRKYGWIEGENVVWDRAFADNRVERLAGLAADLVRRGADVLITNGSEATLAAARATRAVPIIFVGVVWPEEQGLIESFARPGRNVTGLAYYTGVEVTNKRHEFLREIAPQTRRLSWIWPPIYAETVSGGTFDMQSKMRDAVEKLGFEIRFHEVRLPEDIQKALDEASVWRAQALSISGSFNVGLYAQRIADFALSRRLPVATPSQSLVEAGCLLSYGPSNFDPELFKRFWVQVDRVLRGVKPADIPVERPSRYELAINLKTAQALGLKVPPSLLARADRVIE